MTAKLMSILILVAQLLLLNVTAQAGTLQDVQDRGYLRCGVRGNLAGFSMVNRDGAWDGLDVNFCQAIAAAVTGDKNNVEYFELLSSTRFPSLIDGDIDVLIRNTTWTFQRDTGIGVEFTAVTFYDGQGFLALKSLGLDTLTDIKPGNKVCVSSATTSITNLRDYIMLNKLDIELLIFKSSAGAENALFSGRCSVYTTDRSALAAIRATHAPNPADYVILSEVISKEPLSPVVRDDDSLWREIVQWVIFATLEAEELGIRSDNIEQMKNSTKPSILKLLGVNSGIGKTLNLDDQWVVRVIEQVGNYGEIFEHNIGLNTDLKLDRGLNALWKDGGIMYSPPMR